MTRRTVFTLTAVSLAVVLLGGCGIIESKKVVYRSAAKLPTLEIPPDLTQPQREDGH